MVIIPADIDEVLEQADMDFIASCHEDNGTLRRFLENCEDDYTKQHVEHFIRVNDIEIENAMENIENDRRKREELEELSGRGQGDIVPGDVIDPKCKEESYCQHQQPDTLS